MTLSQLMTKVSLGVALVGALAVALPTASHAFGEQQYYYSPDEDGSTFSYYRGYFSNDSEHATRQTQRQQGPARTNNRAPRRDNTEPTQAQERPSCMVGTDGGCK